MRLDEAVMMSPEECWALLGSASLGRLALCIAALPAILPVQYYVDGDAVAMCLGHYELAPRSIDGTVVAFAADAIDQSSGAGWSVQVQGRTTVPRAIGVPTDCGQPAAGQIVHLEPVTITGYRIRLCPFVARIPDDL